ncbi:MAG: hypothetical protein PHU86_02245 [Patescibacteria group bacterium]|nr:hypothetical protein [Patescibacteria group bacterium]
MSRYLILPTIPDVQYKSRVGVPIKILGTVFNSKIMTNLFSPVPTISSKRE